VIALLHAQTRQHHAETREVVLGRRSVYEATGDPIRPIGHDLRDGAGDGGSDCPVVSGLAKVMRGGAPVGAGCGPGNAFVELGDSLVTRCRNGCVAGQTGTGITTLHVTHDAREATLLADRILCLKEGAMAPLTLSVTSE
jgi:hypothetical protein